MTDAKEFVLKSNEKIDAMKEETKLPKNANLNESIEDQAAVWEWGTDTFNPRLYDDMEDYVIELDDESLVKWDNMEREYEEITREELAELLED